MTGLAGGRWPSIIVAGVAVAAWLQATPSAAQQRPEGGDLSIELVDPNVLRVCADPRNLPLSNDKGEGFENKIAELLAARLQKRLAYAFFRRRRASSG